MAVYCSCAGGFALTIHSKVWLLFSPTPLSLHSGPLPTSLISSGTGSHGDRFFCRSSWSRSESSGTLHSTMACHTSWRPWSGCCRRTPSWAISKAGRSLFCPTFHLETIPRTRHQRKGPSGCFRGGIAWPRPANQPEQELRLGQGGQGPMGPNGWFLCINTCGFCAAAGPGPPASLPPSHPLCPRGLLFELKARPRARDAWPETELCSTATVTFETPSRASHMRVASSRNRP